MHLRLLPSDPELRPLRSCNVVELCGLRQLSLSQQQPRRSANKSVNKFHPPFWKATSAPSDDQHLSPTCISAWSTLSRMIGRTCLNVSAFASSIFRVSHVGSVPGLRTHQQPRRPNALPPTLGSGHLTADQKATAAQCWFPRRCIAYQKRDTQVNVFKQLLVFGEWDAEWIGC